jgi:nucleotide-binding universal stress UspA family protein
VRPGRTRQCDVGREDGLERVGARAAARAAQDAGADMLDSGSNLTERATLRRAARQPVLVAVGASGGTRALHAARTIARRYSTDMIVTSVVEPPPLYTFETNRMLLLPWLVEQLIDERRESVHDRLHRHGLVSPGEAEPRVEVRYGDAADTIADIGRELDARLIVLGIGPHSLRHRLLSAGLAWTTGRRALCPILAVGEHAPELPRIAVVATDFSPESIHAAQVALTMLADGALVYLVHAWSRVEAVFPNTLLTTLNDRYAASLPEKFDRVREALGRTDGVTIETLAVEGRPADLVLAVAHSMRADLVVAGTHGRGLVERWLLGSTSSALLRGAECSVLLAPPPPIAERMELVRQMTGTSNVREPGLWDAELRAFVKRNRDRPTALEVDDPKLGAQVQERGLALVGASYDPHDRHVALMFGDSEHRVHFTRNLAHIRAVAVTSGPHDDRALWIESDDGATLVTFLEGSRASPSANA